MLIHGRRIRSLERHLRGIIPGTAVVPALEHAERHTTRLEAVGFAPALETGETLLPRPRGPVSRYNAEGKERVRRDLPMETAYRQVMWEWTERHGTMEISRSDVRDVPYQRYPREFLPPPSLELQVVARDDGSRVIIADVFRYDPEQPDALRHAINVFLELFGECSILQEGLAPVLHGPVRRVNWEILPAGELPWPRLKRRIEPLVERLGPRKRPVVERRLEVIEGLKPDFTAVGHAGFAGYIVLGFEQRSLYVLESLYYGNATYIFGRSWEHLSKLTKAEILTGKLQEARLIHRTGWEQQLRSVLQRHAA
jgi:hypothetical protein